MFFVHTMSEEIKNATATSYFVFVVEENSSREITFIYYCHAYVAFSK